MSTFAYSRNAARLLTIVLAGLIIGVRLAPEGLAIVELAGLPGAFIALYALSLLTFLSFPRLRRSDLTRIVLASVAVLESASAVMLHANAGYTLWIAASAGALAAWAPGYVEALRAGNRSHGKVPVSRPFVERRRGAAARHPQPRGDAQRLLPAPRHGG